MNSKNRLSVNEINIDVTEEDSGWGDDISRTGEELHGLKKYLSKHLWGSKEFRHALNQYKNAKETVEIVSGAIQSISQLPAAANAILDKFGLLSNPLLMDMASLSKRLDILNNVLNPDDVKITDSTRNPYYDVSDSLRTNYNPNADEADDDKLEYRSATFNMSKDVSISPNVEATNTRRDPLQAEDSFDTSSMADMLDFDIPRWGVNDFITERHSWQRQLNNITGEPGWFYFKIFFKFNTNYGLLGGIMGDVKANVFGSSNTAARYLYLIRNYYGNEKIRDRLLALYKFVGLLSFISSDAPWFFKSINNLNQAYATYTNDFSKEKSIEIGCSEEALDMRLNMLFDLYKFACFDNINCKEIIPENLRKFDMTVMVFNMPLKYYQSAFMSTLNNNPVNASSGDSGFKKTAQYFNTGYVGGKIHGFKSFAGDTNVQALKDGYGTGFQNALSFQMFTFSNCEFDVASMGGYYPTLNNEAPINLGKNNIKIKFDRCYKHHLNEWNEIMFGSDGLWYNETLPDRIIGTEEDKPFYMPGSTDNSRKQAERLKAITDGMQAKFNIPISNQYKGLVDFTENFITDTLRNTEKIPAFYHGNLYGQFGVNSEYFQNKLYWAKRGFVKGSIFDKVSTEYIYNKNNSITKLNKRFRAYRKYNPQGILETDINNYNPNTGKYKGI